MKKPNKLINFSMIILCLAIIMFGVYSVSKNATLNVTGHIGLNAHDCEVLVNATIAGDGVEQDASGEIVTSRNGFVSEEREMFSNIRLGGEYKTDDVFEFEDTIWFTDLTEDGKPHQILIKFEILNNSIYPISATANLPMLENENDDLAKLLVSTGASQTGLAEKPSKIKIEANETGYLYVAFDLDQTLVNGVLDYVAFESLTNYSIKVEFAKYKLVETAENGEQYITLGTSRNADGTYKEIKWKPVAYTSNDTALIKEFFPSNADQTFNLAEYDAGFHLISL